MLEFLEKPKIDRLVKEAFPHTRSSWKLLAKGLLNQNILIRADQREYLLKVYRPEVTAQELNEMHRVLEFVKGEGIPVPELVSYQETDNVRVAVYTFLSGKHPSLYSRSRTRIAAMGDMLGRVHVALERYREKFSMVQSAPDPVMPTAEEKLKKIAGLCEKAQEAKPPKYKVLLSVLGEAANRLQSRTWGVHAFDKLPHHLCHGDFHTKNILFSGNRLTGVIDWEKFSWGGHAFEVMRSIVYNCRRTSSSLDWTSVKTYVRAYRQHQELTSLECQLAFPFVFQKLMFGTWAEEQYLKGQRELWDNVERRRAINAYLFRNAEHFTERMARLLAQ